MVVIVYLYESLKQKQFKEKTNYVILLLESRS